MCNTVCPNGPGYDFQCLLFLFYQVDKQIGKSRVRIFSKKSSTEFNVCAESLTVD